MGSVEAADVGKRKVEREAPTCVCTVVVVVVCLSNICPAVSSQVTRKNEGVRAVSSKVPT